MGQHPMNHGALPSEILEEIILGLPPGEIPPLRLLNHRFCQLIDDSPAIQYRLNLFSAGLEERATGESLAIRDRLRKLETYCSRWERLGHVEPIKLGPPPLPTFQKAYAGKGFLIYAKDADSYNQNIHLVRLPSPSMEIALKKWTIRGLPRCTILRNHLAIHPPSDLLAIPVLCDEESSYRVEMFHMSDGKPYLVGARSLTIWDSYPPSVKVVLVRLELTDHRLAAWVSVNPRTGPFAAHAKYLSVWDWRTGDIFLEQTRAPNKIARFIDDYRLINSPLDTDASALTLWDTSIQRNCGFPGLALELESHFDWFTGPHISYSGTSHGLPFCESPSKGVVTFAAHKDLIGDGRTFTQILVINPVGALASLAHKIGTVESVPWQEWQHLANPVPVGVYPMSSRALHSKILDVYPTGDPPGSTQGLRIFDYSLRSRRRNVRDDPSAPLPKYTVQTFPLNKTCHQSVFMEGGVLVTSGSVYLQGPASEERYFCPV